ncbi:MAG: ACP S-malonyltransferase [Velocimicrobium sp.]
MSKIAFLFPGQGAQKVSMGSDFYENCQEAREIFDMASSVLGFDIKEICFTENELLHKTEYTQPALVTTCLAMAKVVEKMGLVPDVCAGLSLGEYCAVATCGGMDAKDAIRLVRKRGILMEGAVPEGVGSMAAVLSLETERIEEILTSIDGVSIANYNCPGQIVITGYKDAVEEASIKLKEAGAKKVIPLKVSGPFHSPFLVEAGNQLGNELDKIAFHPLKHPYVSNVTADYVEDISKTKELFIKQVASPVKWQQSMERMLTDGVDTFIEIGPGKTLSGFLKKIKRDVTLYNIETRKDAEQVKELLCYKEK